MSVEWWVGETRKEIGRQGFREKPVGLTRLVRAEQALSEVEPSVYGDVAMFLDDLCRRPPLMNPEWEAFRYVVENFARDLKLACQMENRE